MQQPPAPPVRNVILITIDTLRADRLGAYGYPRPTSPNLDRFIRRGVRFEWAFSTASYTAPAHISMLTGVYPSFTSVGLDNGRFFKLEGKTITLAELCRDAGLRTAAVVSNPTLNRRLGLHQGFAAFCDIQFDRETSAYLPKHADTTTDEALTLLEIMYDAPFFLWVHYQDPHGPYAPPRDLTDFGEPATPPDRDTVLEAGADTSGYRAIPTYQVIGDERRFSRYSLRYDNEVHFLDTQIQRLFDAIERYGLLETTLVILTADHGEAFSEDEFYFAHSHSVGMDQVRVPLVCVGAGARPGVTLKTPATVLDVFATAVEALRIKASPRTWSRSVLAAVREAREPAARPVFVESFSQRGVVSEGAFLRYDRRPPDSKIWTVSPTSNGFHKPLGEQAMMLGGGPIPPELTSRLRAELDVFSAQADEAIRQAFEALAARPVEDRTNAEQNGLEFWNEKLGYDYRYEAVKAEPKPPTDEEIAHRRALISLGYLSEDDDDGAATEKKPEGEGDPQAPPPQSPPP